MHRAWFATFLAGTAAAVIFFLLSSRGSSSWPGGSSPPGLLFGILGGGIIFFECLLWPRKMFRSRRWGSARAWMKAHIWLGLLTVPLILLHTGFEWGGWLSTTLSLFFIAVIASGIFGLAMQQFLPRRMLVDTPYETIFSEIEHATQIAVKDAESLVFATCGSAKEELKHTTGYEPPPKEVLNVGQKVVIGAARRIEQVPGYLLRTQVPLVPVPNSEALREKFDNTIKPYLESGSRSKSPLVNRRQSAEYFQLLRTTLDPGTHGVVTAIEECCEQRRQFDLQSKLHWWLHSWLWVHLPLSIALLLMMFYHAYVAIKFW